MEIQLLGAVALIDGGERLDLGPPRQRAVLAALALTPRQPVTKDRLAERLWEGRALRQVSNSLQTNVSRLRRVLAQVGVTIQRRDGGYLLDIEPARIDLHRARQLTAQARTVQPDGPQPAVEAAADLLAEAYALWQEPALAGLTGEWVDEVRRGLELERLESVIERFRLELRVGRHAAAIATLPAERASHPLSEPLTALQMQALCQAGRQVEALNVYAEARDLTIRELGEEPGLALQQLHRQILRREPPGSTGPSAGSAPTPQPPWCPPAPAQLPPPVGGFAGRQQLLAQLDQLRRAREATDQVVIVAVDGMAGVGKTALALNWAHRVRQLYPDGQLYADLRAHATAAPRRPHDVLAGFLQALGTPPAAIPREPDTAAAAYRSLLAGRRMLVLLDDATDPEQVRPLLPGAGGSLVLVTSRNRLPGLVAQEGAAVVTVSPLLPEASCELLAAQLGSPRTEAEAEAVRELADLCGQLPLALRIVAADLLARPTVRVSDYVRQLRAMQASASPPLADDVTAAVGATLGPSYDRLPEAARRMFRLLGLLPGRDFEPAAAAALTGADTAQARLVLRELTGAHLLHETGGDRFSLHQLLRGYAAERALREEPPAARQDALSSLYEHYLASAIAAIDALRPGMVRIPAEATQPSRVAFPTADEARGWLNHERTNLLDVVAAAARDQHRAAYLLADAVRPYFTHYWLSRPGRELMVTGLAAAVQAGDVRGQAANEYGLAWFHMSDGEEQPAVQLATRALAKARSAHWEAGEAVALNQLGSIHAMFGRGPAGMEQLEAAVAIAARAGDLGTEAVARNNLAVMYRNAGNLTAAATHASRALAIDDAAGWELTRAYDHLVLGYVCHRCGRLRDALTHYTTAGDWFRQAGNDQLEGTVLAGATGVHADLDDLDAAAAAAYRALALLDGGPRAGLARLARAAACQAAGEYSQAASQFRWVLDHPCHRNRGRALALLGMAAVNCARGEAEDGLDYARQAMELARSLNSGNLECWAQTLLSAAAAAGGDLGRATEHGRRAVALSRRNGDRLSEARALLTLSRASAATGQTTTANHLREVASTVLPGRDSLPALEEHRLLLTGIY